MLLKRVFIGVLFMFSSNLYAQGWTESLTVESVFTEGKTDIIVINTSGGGTYTSSCLPNQWIFQSDTDARRSRAYSTAMAALASGKKIRFWYTDSCENWSYHGATAIMLVK